MPAFLSLTHISTRTHIHTQRYVYKKIYMHIKQKEKSAETEEKHVFQVVLP